MPLEQDGSEYTMVCDIGDRYANVIVIYGNIIITAKEKKMSEAKDAEEKRVDETKADKGLTPEMERTAAQRARDRANAARWNLDVAVFLFAVLIIIIIMQFQGIGIEIVAPVAIFGLAMVWLVGWRRGKQLYQRFYQEEILKLQEELSSKTVKQTIEETIEERVQKAFRERWK